MTAEQEAVRLATEEAVRLNVPFCVVDGWARSRAALVLEMWLGRG